MEWFLTSHQIGLLIFLIVALGIALANSLWLQPLDRQLAPMRAPRLSVLIPARNEEANLENCVRSLMAQDYPEFDIWVLNDHSSDRTGAIAAALAAEDGRIHVLAGSDLPDGWMGKHWACHQLAEHSRGELILFVDADTRCHPAALSGAVSLLERGRWDLLSAVPYEEMETLGEKLLVPYFLFANIAFVPLFLAQALRSPAFAFTVGQFMLFRRGAYERIGGYAAVRADVADDAALGRAVIAGGLRWTLADATSRVRCRMYHGFGEAWSGFSKNMFAGFNYRLIPYVFIWLWCAVAFLEPLCVLALAAMAVPTVYFSPLLAWMSVGLGSLLWVVPYMRLKLPLAVLPLYPLLFCLAFGLAARSLLLAFSGSSIWKGRRLAKPKIRLF